MRKFRKKFCVKDKKDESEDEDSESEEESEEDDEFYGSCNREGGFP